jgi:hypothetical protein
MEKMKKVAIFLFCCICLYSCNNKEKERISASEYNDEMIKIQKEVDKTVVSLISAIDSYDQSDMNEAVNLAKNTIQVSINKVQQADESIDNGKYKSEMLQLLNVYLDIVDNEFSQIIELYALPDEEYSEEDVIKVSELFDSALAKYSIALANFADFQKDFAAYHKLTLTE